jgi:hypothetical protein
MKVTKSQLDAIRYGLKRKRPEPTSLVKSRFL